MNKSRRHFLTQVTLGAAFMLLPRLGKTNINEKPIIIGVGGAGLNILEAFKKQGLDADYLLLDQPHKGMPGTSSFDRVLLSVGVDEPSELAITQCSKILNLERTIQELIFCKRKVLLYAGAGGVTGTLLFPAIANIFKENNKSFAGFCTLPFSFEGKKRNERSKLMEGQLGTVSEVSFFPMDRLRSEHGNMKFSKAFRLADEKLMRLGVEFLRG